MEFGLDWIGVLVVCTDCMRSTARFSFNADLFSRLRHMFLFNVPIFS
jgi:hypothetical protein